MILSLGVIRGVVGQLIFTLIGMAIIFAIRVVMGLPALEQAPTGHVSGLEAAVVFGAVLGAIGFMYGVGALDDWIKWCRGIPTPFHHGPPKDKPAWTRYFSVDYSHKVIGIQYVITALALTVVGGLAALIFRVELLAPEMQYIGMDFFNTLIGTHGIVMIAGILVGVGGMTNYLIPLVIGASDMAFPRLNAFAFWINVPGAILVVAGVIFGGWNMGWTGYPPLGALTPSIGVQLFYIGVYCVGLSSILGAINLMVTIFNMRSPGMGMFRVPIIVWSTLSTSIIALTGTQLIGLSFLMVVVQRVIGLGFFDPNLTEGALAIQSPPGDVILFQHLFWFYSHPAVYVFVLPGFGIISELLPVFCRKPLFGYIWIAMSSMIIALVGFIVWAHHMFPAGMEEWLRVPMMYTTLLVAVPTGVKFFSWVGTMWRGKLIFPTPMLFVLGAISVFLIGGLTGPPNGTVTTDLLLHDTYWIVGHFHATIFGGFVYPFLAAIYYWYPKVTGRKYNEMLGKVHFWLMTPSFWVMSVYQALSGLKGMRRRIADYDPALGIEGYQWLVTIAGFIIAISFIVMFYNLIISAIRGEVAEDNPWGSRSPEWQIPSPVPEISYARPFAVVGDPYDYGKPGSYVQFVPAGGSGAEDFMKSKEQGV